MFVVLNRVYVCTYAARTGDDDIPTTPLRVHYFDTSEKGEEKSAAGGRPRARRSADVLQQTPRRVCSWSPGGDTVGAAEPPEGRAPAGKRGLWQRLAALSCFRPGGVSCRDVVPGYGSAFAEGICGESCNVLRLGAVSRWADLDVNMAGLRDKKSI